MSFSPIVGVFGLGRISGTSDAMALVYWGFGAVVLFTGCGIGSKPFP